MTQYSNQNNTVSTAQNKRSRLLIWLLCGVILLGVVAVGVGIYAFQNVLVPGQQQRVVDQLPFMRSFLPPTPDGGTLPTAAPVDSGISPEDLLNAPPLDDDTADATEEPTPATLEAAYNPATPRPADSTLQLIAYYQPMGISNQPAQVNLAEPPLSARLYGITHNLQSWNNCGPANITMALSYYGWTRDQSYAAQRLKPDREDKNVNPQELVGFVNEFSDLRALTRIGGDITMLKRFIAAQFPVIIETGYMPEGYDWLGHYQTVVAYDDLSRQFYLYDSYLGDGEAGEGMPESYEDLDRNWQQFNRTFIVLYEPSRENEVRQILGDLADPRKAAEIAYNLAQQEARADRRNSYAWFNMGTALTRLERYEEAAAAYDQARREGNLPWRMTWYQFGPFEAYYEMQRYDDVQALVDVNLTNGAQYVEETHYWQGRILEAQGDVAGARAAYTRALQHNNLYTDAREALDNLNN